jgi:ribosome recycling factor
MEDLRVVREKAEKAVAVLMGDLTAFRTGRASPSVVENIICPAYGGTQKLKVIELGNIQVVDPHTITIAPWDPSVIGEVRKGILEANVGLTPVIDGELIRISIPELTTEQREQFVKLLHTKLEAGRVSVRQIRQDQMQGIRHAFENKVISEEERDRAEIDLQKLVDEMITRVDESGKKKETELMTV